MLEAREVLNLKTKSIGVVSEHASAYAESFSSGSTFESPVSTKIADGIACRIPELSGLALIWKGVERIVQVSDIEISDSI